MKNILKFLFLFYFLGTGGIDFAQKQGQDCIDSLLKEVPRQKEDTNKVNMLNSIGFIYLDIAPVQAEKFGTDALELAKKLDYQKGIGNALNTIGLNFSDLGKYNEALKTFNEALQVRKAIGDKKGTGGVYCNIGTVYAYMDKFAETLNCYFAALKMLEEIGDKPFMARVLNNIGIVYANMHNLTEALNYYTRSLQLKKEINDLNGIASAHINIGSMYADLNNNIENRKHLDTALQINLKLNNKSGLIFCYNNIGIIYSNDRNYDMALEFHFKALRLAEEMQNKDEAGGCDRYIGEAYINQKKYKLAEVYMNKGLEAAIISGEIGNKKEADLVLSNLYEKMGQCDKSLKFYKAYKADEDSSTNQEKTKKLVQSQMQYDFEKKESAAKTEQEKKDLLAHSEIIKQRREKQFYIAGFFLLLAFSFFIIRERGKSEKARKQSDGLLLNILPGEIARELKNTGTTVAKHFDNVTILFTDFVNFTQSSAQMNPQSVIDELHACFKTFDEITGKYNIEKIKTIGDAYLAVCGLPLAEPKHAENVVRAAIEINAFMQNRLAKLGNSTFEIRIGIHSGSVVAGIVGVKKFAYDIWGDTVNTAARMEQNSEAGKINISQTTYELVKDQFNCEFRGEIEVKGKGAMKMYYVL